MKSPVDRLISIVSSAIDFKPDTLVTLSQETRDQLVSINEDVLLLKQQLHLRTRTITEIQAQLLKAASLRDEIVTCLKTPPPEVVAAKATQEKLKSDYDRILAQGGLDPEFRANIEKLRDMVVKEQKGMEDYEKLLQHARATQLLLSLGSATAALHNYVVNTITTRPRVCRPNLIRSLHIKLIEYRIRSSLQDLETTFQGNKLAGFLKLIVTLLGLLPSIELVCDVITLKLQLKDDKVRTLTDVKAVISIGPTIREFAAEETHANSELMTLQKSLDQVLDGG